MSDMKALAKRAVGAKGWRWMPGMKCARFGRLYCSVGDHGDYCIRSDPRLTYVVPPETPDFNDAATVQLLMNRLFKLYRTGLTITLHVEDWSIRTNNLELSPNNTQGFVEALVLTLEGYRFP